jgi:cobalt/nickel transport system permease protein
LKHDFLDKYSHLDSPVQRLDPRAKILAAFSGIVIIVTEPQYSGLSHFICYFLIILSVMALTRLPLFYILKRLAVVSPFILMAAIFYPLSIILTNSGSSGYGNVDLLVPALIIFSKSVLAVLILIILTSTEKFHRLLMAMRKLKMPRIIGTISALLYCYIFLLIDEKLKTSRARASRTPGRLRMNKRTVFGNQVAVIFLRSWERSQTIYKSMLSRGFTGEYPDAQTLNLSFGDASASMLFISLMLAVRIWVT